MFYYFSADFQCELRINDKRYFLEGLLALTDLPDDAFIEILPLSNYEPNRNFRLCDLLCGEKDGVRITNLRRKERVFFHGCEVRRDHR